MSHHVLHVAGAAHLPVLVDLTSAPGRTIVFTRTKHRAKRIARQLNEAGVPAVELHGNLSQGQRTRTMEAFHSGAAKTLVATDIAARGIHVDDVGLVIHADPPVEHKAYLHRSGRTARAGASGTVITLMTDDQVRDVRDLTRKAGINPTITRAHAQHPVLAELAPGERSLEGGYVAPAGAERSGGGGGGRRGGGRPGGAAGSPRQGGGPRSARGPRSEPRAGGQAQGQGRPRRGSGSSGRPAAAPSGRSAASFSEGARPRRSR
jgi:hypothetical protein